MIDHENPGLYHAFVVLRFDSDMAAEFGMKTDFISVKKVVGSEDAATREVDRLNRLNGEKGAVYFWRIARLDRALRMGGDAGPSEAQPSEEVRVNDTP